MIDKHHQGVNDSERLGYGKNSLLLKNIFIFGYSLLICLSFTLGIIYLLFM